MGVVTLIYDHHLSRIARRLTDLQHHHLDQVVTTTHVHLDEHRCLEVILLRGPAREIRGLADDLIGTKGVETGRLVLASAQPVPARNGANPSSHQHPHKGRHPHKHPHGHAHQ
jgi:CopG family nickel-responsive transcriptional regulator